MLKANDKVWRELRAKIKKLGSKARVQVGVLGDAGMHHGGISMVELAAIHEYGSPAAHIPARSFIRSAFRDRKQEFAKQLEKVAKAVLSNKMDPATALGRLGLWGANAVKRQITGKNIPPPLKPATIARKGSSKPLVDTGQLVGAISWKVVP